MDNLIIDIGANTQDFLTGLADVGEKTDDLGSQLTGMGVVAGLAFTAITASIMECVSAYRQEELVGQEMQATLNATGGIAGVTSSAIDDLAKSLSDSTTFSKLQVEQGAAMLLTFDEIGKQTFPQATQATLDLAQHMGGDAAGAARVLGRALQDPMNAAAKLSRAQIILTSSQKAQIQSMELAGDMAGAQAIILQAVEDKYGGMAQAAAGGTGQITVLKNAMEEMAVKIGEQFAPAVSSAAEGLADLIKWASENPTIVEYTADILVLASGITGLVTGIVGAILAFEKITAVITASEAAMAALTISTQALVGATGIGLLLIAIYEIYEHWNTIWPAMQAVYKAFVDNIGNAAQGLWKILNGAFTLDMNQIKDGLAQAETAFSQGAKTVAEAFQPRIIASSATLGSAAAAGTQVGQTIENAITQARITAQRAADQQLRTYQAEELAAEGQLRIDSAQHYSAATLAIEKQMVADLKSLADANYKGNKTALAAALKDEQALYDTAYKAETKARTKFNDDYLKNDKAFQSLSIPDQKAYLASHEANLVGSMQNETSAKAAVATADIQYQIKIDNEKLQDQVRFGDTYAEINFAMRDAILKNAESSMSSMSQMTQSKNAELAAIGKASSVLDMEIKGIQAALSVYAGFATIPIIGPELGIAAAAASLIYTQEKVGQVLGMSQGGLLSGGISGVDSIPMMGQAGELVAPKQNFDEVVNSVAASRNGQSGQQQQVQVVVEIDFKGSASRILTAQINQDKALGRYRGTSS